MRRLFVILSALMLLGATVGCSQLDHGSAGGGCNCGGGGMVSGPAINEGGTMMSSSSMSGPGVVVSGSGQPTEFMGQAQKMPQAQPMVIEVPPTH
jgi:hypothetical protein